MRFLFKLEGWIKAIRERMQSFFYIFEQISIKHL